MKYANLPPNQHIGDYSWNDKALLGKGAYGTVYLGRRNGSNQLLAIKVMNNSDFADQEMKKALDNELLILKTLKGVPNNMGLVDHVSNQAHQYIIQKFCDGGDGRGMLSKKGVLPEQEAKKVFGEMLAGMNQLVQRKIIHRDLKPENTLFDGGIGHIADYGFSAFVNNFDNEKLTFFGGTPLYMCPQIMANQSYTTKCDVWSMGIIYYEMLCGKTPFPCNSIEELKQNTFHMPVNFPYNIQISNESKEIIKRCLTVDENKRISWQELLHHPLFTNPNAKLNYAPQANFDQAAKEIITKLQQVIVQHNVDVEKVFQKFDSSHDGQLDEKEFCNLLCVINPQLSPQTLGAVFKQFDASHDGKVSLEEFKRLALETNYGQPDQTGGKMLLEMRANAVIKQLRMVIERDHVDVMQVFKQFDKSGDQNLDVKEFGNVLRCIDPSLHENEVQYIFKQFDQDNSKTISFQEFYKKVK